MTSLSLSSSSLSLSCVFLINGGITTVPSLSLPDDGDGMSLPGDGDGRGDGVT